MQCAYLFKPACWLQHVCHYRCHSVRTHVCGAPQPVRSSASSKGPASRSRLAQQLMLAHPPLGARLGSAPRCLIPKLPDLQLARVHRDDRARVELLRREALQLYALQEVPLVLYVKLRQRRCRARNATAAGSCAVLGGTTPRTARLRGLRLSGAPVTCPLKCSPFPPPRSLGRRTADTSTAPLRWRKKHVRSHQHAGRWRDARGHAASGHAARLPPSSAWLGSNQCFT